MKKNNTDMKPIAFFLFLLSSLHILQAQSSLSLEATQWYANFSFKDSDGGKQNKDYQGIFTGSYMLGYRYDFDFGLMIKTGIGMRSAGAHLVYDDSDYSWDLQYLDLRLGVGYQYKLNRISPYLMVSGYYGNLLSGSQVLNNEHFNIKESELMETSDFGMIFSPGANIRINDRLHAFAEFNYLLGLANIEKDEEQTAKNTGMGLTLGLSLSISK